MQSSAECREVGRVPPLSLPEAFMCEIEFENRGEGLTVKCELRVCFLADEFSRCINAFRISE